MKHIIHFTSSFDSLKSILTSRSLLLHYCKEDFCLGEKKISRAAHPMICFSECDLSSINNKVITYGNFGIAFSKKWINKNKIHPVIYIDSNSVVAESLASLLVARRKNADVQLSSKVKNSIMTIKCFTKNARGYNSYHNVPNFNFKDENEWRYVPTKRQIGGKLISQDRSKYMARKKYYNDQLIDYALKFSIEDIEFFFVKNEVQKEEILRMNILNKGKIMISRWKTK